MDRIDWDQLEAVAASSTDSVRRRSKCREYFDRDRSVLTERGATRTIGRRHSADDELTSRQARGTEAACRRKAWPASVLPTGDAADCPDGGSHDDGCRLLSAALAAALAA